MLRILIEAASFIKENFKYNINQHENEAVLFHKILLFSLTDDKGIHIQDFDYLVLLFKDKEFYITLEQEKQVANSRKQKILGVTEFRLSSNGANPK